MLKTRTMDPRFSLFPSSLRSSSPLALLLRWYPKNVGLILLVFTLSCWKLAVNGFNIFNTGLTRQKLPALSKSVWNNFFQSHDKITKLKVLTFFASFLSARRANTSPTKYTPNMTHTVVRTTKFLVSPSRVNSVKTLSKSMGLGATKIFPPNAERCVHRHCRFLVTSFNPTFEKRKGTV